MLTLTLLRQEKKRNFFYTQTTILSVLFDVIHFSLIYQYKKKVFVIHGVECTLLALFIFIHVVSNLTQLLLF